MSTRLIESQRRENLVSTLAALAVLAGACILPASALGQDWRAMVEQQNATVAAAQQQAYQIVQQKMQDPQVQAAYRQHQAQSAQSGTQPYDFPTFAYYYVATRGFSPEGKAAWNASEGAIQRNEQRAWQEYQDAQAASQSAINDLQAGYHRNQQEAGRQLMGQSTFVSPSGQTQALPHTWQPNTYNTYQGNTYFVDPSGQYWVSDPNNSGYWHPLRPAP